MRLIVESGMICKSVGKKVDAAGNLSTDDPQLEFIVTNWQLIDLISFSLVKVSDSTDSGPPTPAPASGIVGALMEVMQKRSKAIHSSGKSCLLDLKDPPCV